jgi:hypothetical protein
MRRWWTRLWELWLRWRRPRTLRDLVWPSGRPFRAEDVAPGSGVQFEVLSGKVVAVNPPEPAPEPPVTADPVRDLQAEVEEYDEAAPARPHKPHKKHDFSYHYLRQDVSEAASRILDWFDDIRRNTSDYSIDMNRSLEELWGCDFLLLDREIAEKMKGGDRWSVVDATQAEHVDAVWPVDYAFAIIREDDEDDRYRTGVELFRLASVEPRDVRGHNLVRVVPRMLKVTIGNFFDGREWSCMTTYVGLVGDAWVRLRSNDDTPVRWRRYLDETLKRLVPSILTARYEWHVAIGAIAGGPRVLLPTNPASCVGLFKNRDVPVAGGRRDKMRHWVGEHWRDDDDAAGLIYVRNHLRGMTRFDWAGFGCEVFPSAFDLEKNEAFRAQAAEWRAQRKHNRVRVRLKGK